MGVVDGFTKCQNRFGTKTEKGRMTFFKNGRIPKRGWFENAEWVALLWFAAISF